ncbi:MAG TPA: hypothetical protein VNZ01_07185, partial [Solirubrobacteraceae bacterium]|nr:hypothetical protein [Solirubrobacteraceae bacterium]
MPRVLALVPDLLFGSRVQGTLQAAGHEVELMGGPERLAERLQAEPHVSVLIVDLTSADLDGPALVQSL